MTVALTMVLCTACTSAQVDRLEWVGKTPPMQDMANPEDKRPPMSWPTEASSTQKEERAHNSLWAANSKSFFRDTRANKVGDIVKVKVEIADTAKLDNSTQRSRQSSDNVGAPNIFGLQNKLVGWLPGKANPDSLLETTGSSNNTGQGNIERKETINTEVAAAVTQVLPNGNMVIYGSQEIRVNYEIRQLTVQGVIRPEDISPLNEVQSNQIAEARISYGGQGVISDVQQPRLGSQIIDILSPW